MKHLQFFIKYYKYYFDGEIVYTPDWIFESKRQQIYQWKYESLEVFHNDKGKNFSHVCLFDSKDKNKKYYKKMTLMSIAEKRQYIADYLSGE